MNRLCKFAVIADPHYYSEKLGCNGRAYEMRQGSDQKMLAMSRSTVIAALEEIKKSDAEFLLIAGDLSNDGEKCSHEEMRELLYEFKKSKPVYIITATHDWCCDGNPRRYEGDKVYNDVETIAVNELSDFYKDFGLNECLSQFRTHQNKASYTVRPCEGITIFCLDDDQSSETNEDGSGYSPEHWTWIENQVKEAKKRGDIVVGMQHHHLFLTEFDRAINGKRAVEYKEKMCKTFAEIDFPFMFTGHSHMQHIRKIYSDNNKPFYEINVASISGYPAPICYVEATKKGLNIETKHLESFTYKGETYSNNYLKTHATKLFSDVIDSAATGEKEKFQAVVEAIGMSHEKSAKIWKIAKPVLRWLNKLTVKKAARIMNFISFGKAIDKKAAKEIGDVLIKDAIFSTFHSILDGSIEKHPVGTAYYTVFTQVLAFPLRLIKKLKIKNGGLIRTLTHIKNAAPELMTGGPLDNNNFFLQS